MSFKHYTTQLAEEAAKCPRWATPYCWAHRRHKEWHGSWVCRECSPSLFRDAYGQAVRIDDETSYTAERLK